MSRGEAAEIGLIRVVASAGVEFGNQGGEGSGTDKGIGVAVVDGLAPGDAVRTPAFGIVQALRLILPSQRVRHHWLPPAHAVGSPKWP